MSHEIESALYVGTPAWHGLGKVVQEAPTTREAITMAGLDWTVRKEPLELTADGRVVPAFASVRSSDDSILGVVGPNWTPLQNSEAFEWFDPLIDAGLVKLEAAGSLRKGQRVWMLAKAGIADVQEGDPVEQYVLLSNGHDGKLAVRVGFTSVRVVCANTLAVAHNEGSLIRVCHHQKVAQNIEKLREMMDLATAQFEGTVSQMRLLSRAGCSEIDLHRYVREVFSPGHADDPKAAKHLVAKVVPLFENGKGAELSRGTYWGAFNAVTEYITHQQGRTQESRLNSQWFGSGMQTTNRALSVALEMAA